MVASNETRSARARDARSSRVAERPVRDSGADGADVERPAEAGGDSGDGGGRLRSYLLLAAGMSIFGSGTPVSAIVTEAFPVFLASGARMLIAAVLLLALIAAGDGFARLKTVTGHDWLLLGGIAVAGMFLFSVFMLYGMKQVSGAAAGILMATTPAVTAGGSVLFLRDRLDRWRTLAVVCAVGGVAVVNVGSMGDTQGDGVLLGSALILGAVCGEAAYTLLGKKLTADLNALWVAALAAVLACGLFVVPAVVQAASFDWTAPALRDWLALLWWGAGTMALGSLLWYRGVSRVRASTVPAFMGLMPVSALLLSYLLLDESFAWIHLLGMAAVLAGIAAVTRSHAR